ncbi:hypothetical protein J4477_02950 [Candidatus Pacearchaeota archaeon]|nr:hypothetical protein [Candidatus Pacearchaeota archaeon]
MGFWKILGITFLVVIILVLAGSYILYNLVPFHIVSFCIYNEGTSIPIQCTANADCQSDLSQLLDNSGSIVNIPGEIKDKLSPVIEEAILCVNELCFVKNILLMEGEGIASDYIGSEIPKAKSCEGKRIDINVYGKEVLEFYINNKNS